MPLDNPQASLNIFDIHSLILNIITENLTYFINTVDNCWLNVNVTTVLQLCPDSDKYLFVDSLYFTFRAHWLIADAIRSFLFNSSQVNSAVTFIPQLNSNDTLIFFFLLQLFHFFQ
jgi:phospholipase/lecithinase/hemolysin